MQPLEIRAFFAQTYEQARAIHHVTNSYAVHKAMGGFYDSWSDLTDDFIETWQGKYGRIQGEYEMEVNTSVEPFEFITTVANTLRMNLYPGISDMDADLQNIAADLIGLADKTLYLLTLK